MLRRSFLAALAALMLSSTAAVAAPPPNLGPVAVTQCEYHPVLSVANSNYVTADPVNQILAANSNYVGWRDAFAICREPGTNLTTLQLLTNNRFAATDLSLPGDAWATLHANATEVSSDREKYVTTFIGTGHAFALRSVATGRYVTVSLRAPYVLRASGPTTPGPRETFTW